MAGRANGVCGGAAVINKKEIATPQAKSMRRSYSVASAKLITHHRESIQFDRDLPVHLVLQTSPAFVRLMLPISLIPIPVAYADGGLASSTVNRD